MSKPFKRHEGYCLEMGYRDYRFFNGEAVDREILKSPLMVWSLHLRPQRNCPRDPFVFRGRFWIQPRYTHAGWDMANFTPLFLGKMIKDPGYPYSVLVEPPGLIVVLNHHQ